MGSAKWGLSLGTVATRREADMTYDTCERTWRFREVDRNDAWIPRVEVAGESARICGTDSVNDVDGTRVTRQSSATTRNTRPGKRGARQKLEETWRNHTKSSSVKPNACPFVRMQWEEVFDHTAAFKSHLLGSI